MSQPTDHSSQECGFRIGPHDPVCNQPAGHLGIHRREMRCECRGILPAQPIKPCTLCRCPGTHVLFGFPVCTYHETHGEDEPPCPTCAKPIPPTIEERQSDAHYLLGAASYLLEHLAKTGDEIIAPMAADWIAAYNRFSDGRRAELRYRTWAETHPTVQS